MPGVGAAIGGSLGGLLFPERLPGVSGPRLNDAEVTVSTEGQAIPIVLGSHVVAGNIIDAAPLREVENSEEVGGKGGPTQEVTSFSYFLTFALALCEGPIGGVRRIWANGKIIYDRRPQQDGESDPDYATRLTASDELDERMTTYLGDEDQLPDPLLEAVHGAGNVPGHRGMAYLVFEDYDVTDLGGRPPSFKVEVVRQFPAETETTDLAYDALYPWIEGTGDPRHPDNTHEYYNGSTWISSSSDALAAIAAARDFVGYSDSLIGWTRDVTAEVPSGSLHFVSDYEVVSPDELPSLNLHYNRTATEYRNRTVTTPPATYCAFTDTDPPTLNTRIWHTGIDVAGLTLYGGFSAGTFYADPEGGGIDAQESASMDGLNNCTGYTVLWTGDLLLRVQRVPSPPPLPGSDLPDWPVNPDEYWWDEDTGQIYSKEPWVEVAGDYLVLSLYQQDDAPPFEVIRYPLGPVLELGDAASTEAYWTAARDAAVLAGYTVGSTYQADGLGDEDTFPRYSDRAWTRTYTELTFPDEDGVTVQQAAVFQLLRCR